MSITSLVFTGTAAADEPDYSVDISISAAFDKAVYDSDDTVGGDVTITNLGTETEAVGGIDGFEIGELLLDQESSDLMFTQFDLAPGASKVEHLTGSIRETTEDHRVVFNVSYNAVDQDDNPADNTVTISAPVTQVYGAVDGHAYIDADHDGGYDPGEGLAQVVVTLSDYWTFDQRTTVTDADGAYRLDQVPTGTYYVDFSSPDGWVFHPTSNIVELDRAGFTQDASAVRPLSDNLHASATFAKLRYDAGATATVTIKIRNSGDTAIPGIHTTSGGAGSDADLESADCGALDDVDTGIVVPAKHTVTVTCTGTVSDRSGELGLVSLFRGVGLTDRDDLGVTASASAKVGHLRTSQDLWVGYDENDNGVLDDNEGVAGAKLTLVDANTGVVKAKVTSDAQGNATVADISTGLYNIRVASPWRARPDSKVWITTHSGCQGSCGKRYVTVTPR